MFFSYAPKTYFFNDILQKLIVFLEDYALLINALNDLSDKTMNFKYKDLAKKLCIEAINKFYLKEKDIFQKNQKERTDKT